jgi:hypothetical protein
VVLAEELAMMAEQQRRVFAAGMAEDEGAPGEASSVWPAAIRYAALAGVVAAGLLLLSVLAPPLLLLLLLWAVGAPVIVLGVYAARSQQKLLRPGFGARLGFLCGLFIALAVAIVNVSSLLLERYVFHNAGMLDGQLTALFNQMRTSLLTQGGAEAAPVLHWLTMPQYRAGLLLTFSGIFAACYLALSTAGGAFAGLLRSRGEPR